MTGVQTCALPISVEVLAAGGSDTATLQITVNMNPLEPPAKPTGLGVTAGDKVVTLDWDDNSEPDLASYSVYRSTTLGSPGTALASGLSTSDYTDSTVTNDTTYYYSVTAIDEDGNESDRSDELDATPVESVSSYQNDFSSAPTIENESGNTSPWINNNVSMPPAGQYTFVEGFASLTHDAVNNNLEKSGNANIWLLINTSTWEPGDYTVTFDGRVSSGAMSWDVIGGNASSSGTGLRLWMNKGSPYIRAASSGTAERLGQINEAGDTAGSATASVAAGSFSNTDMAPQGLNITLTDAHTGSPNNYIMIGWAGASGLIDNLSIVSASDSTNDFGAWISGFNVDGLTAFTDDFDYDNLPNGIESYFGTDPDVFNAGVILTSVDTGAETFTFTHPINDAPVSDITAAYRWSKDLSAGFHADGATAGGTTVTFSQGMPKDDVMTVTATIEGTPTELMFVDIEVMQN